ncbi:hypothetical protein GQ473_04550 [archaeon]|nr:hypothetical protein [archaeon]
MVRKTRKGQVFLIGAFVLCIMIASVVSGRSSLINDVPFDTTKNSFSNTILESKKVINIIAKENMTSYNMENRLLEYSLFLNRIGKEHNMNITGYFIVAIPNGADMNVSIINFGNYEMKDITIRINDTDTVFGSVKSMQSDTKIISNVPQFMSFNYSYLESTGISDELFSEEVNTSKKLFTYTKIRFENPKNARQSISYN